MAPDGSVRAYYPTLIDATPPETVVQRFDEKIRCLRYSPKEMVYTHDLKFGSQRESTEFGERLRSPGPGMTPEQFQKDGWTVIPLNNSDPVHRYNPASGQPLGFWFENGLPCAMEFDREVPRAGQTSLFRIYRFQPDGRTRLNRVPSPIRWDHSQMHQFDATGWARVVTSCEGGVFVICCDSADGRLHILRWNGTRLERIATHSNSFLCNVCPDAGAFFCLAVGLPTLLLGMLAWFLQRRQLRRTYSFGQTNVRRASIVRRGVARLIDLAVVLTPLTLSVVLHPDVFGWWFQIAESSRQLNVSLRTFSGDVIMVKGAFQNLLSDLVAAPIVWWIFVPAIAIFIAQTIWQGRSGRTVGKWLLGIKVERTTLRPCGVARSLCARFCWSLIVRSCYRGRLASFPFSQHSTHSGLVTCWRIRSSFEMALA